MKKQIENTITDPLIIISNPQEYYAEKYYSLKANQSGEYVDKQLAVDLQTELDTMKEVISNSLLLQIFIEQHKIEHLSFQEQFTKSIEAMIAANRKFMKHKNDVVEALEETKSDIEKLKIALDIQAYESAHNITESSLIKINKALAAAKGE